MITRTSSIAKFLQKVAPSDLADLYNINMECQVNVAVDGGELITGEYKGKTWRGWTDGLTTWKHFRIPYKANTEPEYNDVEMKFDLAAHAEGIGMTGWDWKNRCSRWVAYDFDAIVGHAEAHQKKLTDSELSDVITAAKKVDWVTLRRSTSGNGLHLYVMLEEVPTKNHNEHAALARAVLGLLSAETGFDFCNKVDICGGNMWVWHRRLGNNGLSVFHQGKVLTEVPLHWEDHVKVVKGRSQKTIPEGISDPFELLTARKVNVQLDEEHRRHLQWLKDNNAVWWWDQDQHMLVTHTIHLKDMHEALQLTGIFKTITRHSSAQNCFCFPLRNGAWVVRRYSIGVNEHPMWEQDGDGWTRTFFNKLPSVQMAARAFEGIENTKGEFEFRLAESAVDAAALLGVDVKIDPLFITRQAWMMVHKDGRLIVSVRREDTDSPSEVMKNWVVDKKRYTQLKTTQTDNVVEAESSAYDDVVRHLVSEDKEDAGWVMKNNDNWNFEPLAHIRLALASYGMKAKDVTGILGASIVNCWQLVNRPFQPEYPGDRLWNLKAARLRYDPADPTEELPHPTWDKILQHCGAAINDAVTKNPWCLANNIKTGGEYLKLWVASMLQNPYDHLPYLFFYSQEQGTGKTTFYEAHRSLFVHGFVKANQALKSDRGFNGELHGAILCAIEEEDLGGHNKAIYDRIKDWVTGEEILIHPKGKTPYHVLNTTHWVQCSNDHRYCPVFPGDTRVTMITVQQIDPLDMIPAPRLKEQLRREAPAYLSTLLNLDIPDCDDRLRVPAIETTEKRFVQEMNKSEVERFVDERIVKCDGAKILFSEFYNAFIGWLDLMEQSHWSKTRVSRGLPPNIPKGRARNNAQFHLCNVKWATDERTQPSRTLYVDASNYISEV